MERVQRRGYYPWSFSCFCFVFFFHGHLPQTSSFCLAKQKFIASFATQARACTLSERNTFCTLRGGRTMAGHNALGLFLSEKETAFET